MISIIIIIIIIMWILFCAETPKAKQMMSQI
jgi:hypothetical protein